MSPIALITGITGQDGSYLAELLLEKGYVVHGLVWPPVAVSQSWLAKLEPLEGSRLFLRTGDMRNGELLRGMVQEIRPTEIYHLAGQTHVVDSFNDPEAALELNSSATVRLLEVARHADPMPRLFHASSAEIFGHPAIEPQDESTPFDPGNPYACAKAFSTQMLRVYRKTYGLFASNGILYPHESPRRGGQFLSKQVCHAAAAAKLGRAGNLSIGDPGARRDWGDARDVVRGMWLALQHPSPEDFVFATGQLHSVQELVETAFSLLGLDWRQWVTITENPERPTDLRRMVGNSAKARRLLGWEPRTRFEELIREMVQAELQRLQA